MTANVSRAAFLLATGLALSSAASARDVGGVDTVFHTLTPNDKIRIEAFEDPKVSGVTCFVSRAVKGGALSIVGLAEDPSDASIACRQTGPITFREAIEGDKDGEEVFNEKRSVMFKTLHVTRFFDQASQSLVYLTWSDKLIDGSPKNSLSAVTLQPWGTQAAAKPALK